MIARTTSVLALALLSTLGARLHAQRFTYAVGTGAYSLVSKTASTQESMGQKADMEITSTQRLRLELTRRTRDTMALAVTVDSIQVRHSIMGVVDASQLLGRTFGATIAPDGRIYAVQSSAGVDASQADQLVRFIPHVAGMLRAGVTWTDTLAGRVQQSGLTLDRQIVTVSTVAGDTLVDGQQAWRITRDATMRVTGSGSAQGQPISVDGTGTGGGTYLVSGKGVFLGAELSDSMDAIVTIAATGMQLSTTTKSTATIARLQ